MLDNEDEVEEVIPSDSDEMNDNGDSNKEQEEQVQKAIEGAQVESSDSSESSDSESSDSDDSEDDSEDSEDSEDDSDDIDNEQQEQVEQAIDTRSSMGVLRNEMDTFVKYKSAEAIGEAAKNPGVSGLGTQLGTGMALGEMVRNAIKSSNEAPAQKEETGGAKEYKFCPECGTKNNANAKFCIECGKKMLDDNACPNCGKKLRQGAKFCSECGAKIK